MGVQRCSPESLPPPFGNLGGYGEKMMRGSKNYLISQQAPIWTSQFCLSCAVQADRTPLLSREPPGLHRCPPPPVRAKGRRQTGSGGDFPRESQESGNGGIFQKEAAAVQWWRLYFLSCLFKKTEMRERERQKGRERITCPVLLWL